MQDGEWLAITTSVISYCSPELGPDAMLPPVLPLVLYNGGDPWSVRLNLGGLIMPAPDGLAACQASQHYLLIDLHKLDPVVLAKMRSVLALLFRLELSTGAVVELEVLSSLATWLEEDAQAPLRRDVVSWVERMMNTQFGSVSDARPTETDAQRIVRTFTTWAREFENRGLEKGLEQGLEKGREQASPVLRSVLYKVLASRFDGLPPGLTARMAQAPLEQLQLWLERAIDADTIDAVFAAPPASDSST
jgi:hypothetical protein